jgi:hypothetical protein
MADAPVGPADGGGPDAAVPRCDPSVAFRAPVEVPLINTAYSDEAVFVSADGQHIWFSRALAQGNANAIYTAKSDGQGGYTGIMQVDGANTSGAERGPSVSTDGRRLFVSIGGGTDFTIEYAAADSSGKFGALQSIPGVTIDARSTGELQSSVYSVPQPAGEARIVLYFASNVRPDGTQATPVKTVLYRTQGTDDKYDTPEPVAMPDQAGNTASPVVTPDELTLYFTMNNKVYFATRTSQSLPFGPPSELTSVNATNGAATSPSFISANDCELYVSVVTTVSSSAQGYKAFHAVRITGPR